MPLLLRLFIRRFRLRKYAVPLGILVLLQILLRIMQSVIEDFVLSKIADYTGISGHGMILLSAAGIALILVWMYFDARSQFTAQYLHDVLRDMHRRLLSLKDVRLSRQRLAMNQVETVAPVLMDRLDLVPLGHWPKFRKSVARQVRRPITTRSRLDGTWRYKVSAVASRIKKDLVDSKKWTMADLDIVADWLDGQNWGLQPLRDGDEDWNRLYGKIAPFTTDHQLRLLIDKHISLSYGACSIMLIAGYAAKWPTSIDLEILRATLLGSPLRPVKLDLALSEVLSDIEARMHVLSKRRRHTLN